MSKTDLTSRDWVAFTTKRLVYNTDPSVSVNLLYREDGGMNIVISNISETSIGKLPFLTNNDSNNNYLYLESLQVYIDGNNDTLEIAGLSNIAVSMFQNSDANAYISSEKLHYPFTPNNIYNQVIKPNTITFNDLVDKLSSVIPYTESTFNHIKKYSLILNPDRMISQSKANTALFSAVPPS
jgi:predicted butyrate kinase (DUF1464 family)